MRSVKTTKLYARDDSEKETHDEYGVGVWCGYEQRLLLHAPLESQLRLADDGDDQLSYVTDSFGRDIQCNQENMSMQPNL